MQKILTAAIVAAFATSAFAQVAINEVDYQNPGTDSTEWIELTGKAGTDLTGYSLVLINGSDGSVYNTAALSGSIPADFTSAWGGDGGFFVVGTFDTTTAAVFGSPDLTPPGWTTNQIQNGSPDLIQLYDASGTLLDEWEYASSVGTSITGLSQAFTAYDSAGTGGDITTYSSIGRRGYSYGAPMFVFDEPAANLSTPSVDNTFDHETNATLSGTGPAWTNAAGDFTTVGPYTEAEGAEIVWSGTAGYGADRGISPGTFNNASYGTAGIQDEYTINIIPEPASLLLLALGALALRRR